MRNDQQYTILFKDHNTTNAVLTVLYRYNRGIDDTEAVRYAADKHKVSVHEIEKYWMSLKERGWGMIKREVMPMQM